MAVRERDANGDRLLGGQAAAFLAAVGSRYPNAVSVSFLAEALWQEQPPASASVGLRVVATRVRGLLRDAPDENPLPFAAESYRLDLPPEALDWVSFEQLVSAARDLMLDGFPAEALRSCQEALDSWRGEPFGELGTAPWLLPEATRLRLLRLQAEDLQVDAHLALDEPELAADLAEVLTDQEPLREDRWARRMLALYRCGRQTDALRSFQLAKAHLADEVGLEPGSQLRALEQAVLLQSPDLDPSLVAEDPDEVDIHRFVRALRSSTLGRPPSFTTTFVGRDRELETVASSLRTHRLVTIVGPGGAGKTRLAAAAAERSDRPEVVFVELAPHSVSSIGRALADQLRLQPRADEHLTDTLVRSLRDSNALVVLDNCEHVLEAVGPLAEAIVSGCPMIAVLATSRVPLGTESETRVNVGSLTVDDARRLLADRAAAVGSTPLPAGTDAAVDRLLGRLDHLPLAIELAAGQLDVMTTVELDQLVERSIASLQHVGRTEHRHRQMSASVDWSYGLLTPGAATTLDALAVMIGPFEAADALAIAGVPGDIAREHLRELSRSSLLVADQLGSATTFRVLETVRMVATARAADRLPVLRTRHLEHFRDLASTWAPGLRDANEGRAGARLEPLMGQFRAAFAWAIESGDLAGAAGLAIDLADFGLTHLHYDTFDWAEAIVSATGAEHLELYPDLLASAALGAWARSDPPRARTLAESALDIAAQRHIDPPVQAHVTLTNVAGYEGRSRDAVTHLEAVSKLAQAMDEPYLLTNASVITAIGASLIGATEMAAWSAAVALDVAVRSQNPSSVAWASYASGLADIDPDPIAAIESFEHGGAVAESVQNAWILGMNMSGMVTALRRAGRDDQALAALHDLLVLWHRSDNRAQLGHALTEAALLLSTAQPDLAGDALAAADSIALSFPCLPGDRPAVDAVRASIGPRRLRSPATDDAVHDLIVRLRTDGA